MTPKVLAGRGTDVTQGGVATLADRLPARCMVVGRGDRLR